MNSYDDVNKFLKACDQNEKGFSKQSDLYFKLIEEEFKELKKAYQEKDLVEIADACADLKWVIEGLEITMNLPQQEVWDEVARSNLNKISSDGKVKRREDGKILKPKDWEPPNIRKVIKMENK